MTQTTLIGIDVGTTATKAVLIDADGQLLARFSQPHRDQPAGARIRGAEPRRLDGGRPRRADDVCRASTISAASRGIGICSQVNTHVFVDAGGTAAAAGDHLAGRAVRCRCGRARCAGDGGAEDSRGSAGRCRSMPATRCPGWRMCGAAHPEVYAATAHVLLPKDYCVLQLTGAVASDPISAVGLVNARGLCRTAARPGARRGRAPAAAVPIQPCRRSRARTGLPCAGTPVVVGAMDAWGGMFGRRRRRRRRRDVPERHQRDSRASSRRPSTRRPA